LLRNPLQLPFSPATCGAETRDRFAMKKLPYNLNMRERGKGLSVPLYVRERKNFIALKNWCHVYALDKNIPFFTFPLR
jgi:hypothetical protein